MALAVAGEGEFRQEEGLWAAVEARKKRKTWTPKKNSAWNALLHQNPSEACKHTTGTVDVAVEWEFRNKATRTGGVARKASGALASSSV